MKNQNLFGPQYRSLLHKWLCKQSWCWWPFHTGLLASQSFTGKGYSPASLGLSVEYFVHIVMCFGARSCPRCIIYVAGESIWKVWTTALTEPYLDQTLIAARVIPDFNRYNANTIWWSVARGNRRKLWALILLRRSVEWKTCLSFWLSESRCDDHVHNLLTRLKKIDRNMDMYDCRDLAQSFWCAVVSLVYGTQGSKVIPSTNNYPPTLVLRNSTSRIIWGLIVQTVLFLRHCGNYPAGWTIRVCCLQWNHVCGEWNRRWVC